MPATRIIEATAFRCGASKHLSGAPAPYTGRGQGCFVPECRRRQKGSGRANDKFSGPLIPRRAAGISYGNDWSHGNTLLQPERAAAAASRLRAAPAPGYRDYGRTPNEGIACGVGNYGYSWSSAVSGTYSVWLDFNTTHVNPSHKHGRAHGFQVRCLQEFIGAPCHIPEETGGVLGSGVPARGSVPAERTVNSAAH